MSADADAAWPVDLVFDRTQKSLHVAFDDGAKFDIPFELLRVESPSAEVQGHGPSQKVVVTGKADVGVTKAEPVGRYAVRIIFDDGHDSGLFTWPYLRKLGREKDSLLQAHRKAARKA
ncbi:MAG: DUF971 domain-containing protein [Caulobacterales bacterium]